MQHFHQVADIMSCPTYRRPRTLGILTTGYGVRFDLLRRWWGWEKNNTCQRECQPTGRNPRASWQSHYPSGQ